MVDRPESDAAAVRYLLGVATEQEKTALEETLFKDSSALEEISAVEDELIDDYLSGELPSGERDQFEKAYFASPERRQRVEFARTLRNRLAQGSAPQIPQARAPAVSKFPLLLAAAAVLFALLAALFASDALRLRREARQLQAEQAASAQREQELSRRASEAQQETERLKQQVAQERAERVRLAHEVESLETAEAKTVSFTLIAGLVRGNGNLPTVRVAPDTVSLRLTAPMQVTYPSYRAAVQTPEGKTLWRGPALPSAAGGHSIAVTLPAKDIPPGDYILSVTGVTAAGREESAADFSFRVKKP